MSRCGPIFRYPGQTSLIRLNVFNCRHALPVSFSNTNTTAPAYGTKSGALGGTKALMASGSRGKQVLSPVQRMNRGRRRSMFWRMNAYSGSKRFTIFRCLVSIGSGARTVIIPLWRGRRSPVLCFCSDLPRSAIFIVIHWLKFRR